MSSGRTDTRRRSAAWRFAGWSTLAFAAGTAAALLLAALLVNEMIRSRTDTWLRGESTLLAELVAGLGERSEDMALLREEAGHALREISEDLLDGAGGLGRPAGKDDLPDGPAACFLWLDAAGAEALWVGPADPTPFRSGLARVRTPSGRPFFFDVAGWPHRFRGVRRQLADGGQVMLGVWDVEAWRLRRRLSWIFAGIWGLMVVLGAALSWLTARSILAGVEDVARTADSIDSAQMDRRVPHTGGGDEISRLAATFNRMLDRIQASVLQIRTMTDGLAHDLKSPLTAVRGRLELAAGSDDPATMRDAMAAGLEGIDRLLRVLNDSLDVAEAEAGALRLRRTDLDLAALVEEMVAFYRPAAEERGIVLAGAGPAALPILGDADLLRRALANLLDNAIRHLPAGSRVTVDLAAAGARARLTVGDDGPGFAPDVRERAFERFVRGAGSRGSGLGLAVVRAVARSHGGDASLGRSRLGGAAVILDLPVRTG